VPALSQIAPPGVSALAIQTALQNGVLVSDVPGPTGGIMLKSATGATQVNIVTHSMGTISVRYYIDSLGGASKVHAFAGLGATNHGTTLAAFLFTASGIEMRPNSTLLNHLNATDESPFVVGYATWRTPCDEAVSPHDSPILNGAQLNIETVCMSHSQLHEDATVYGQVKSFIETYVAP